MYYISKVWNTVECVIDTPMCARSFLVIVRAGSPDMILSFDTRVKGLVFLADLSYWIALHKKSEMRLLE